MDTAKLESRMTRLVARRTGDEEAAAAIVKNLLNRKPEPSCSEGSQMGPSPLMRSPTFGDTRESSPFGASSALLDGMKFGGKNSSELNFDKFIGSGDTARNSDMPQFESASGTKSVTNPIAQNLTNGPANQAMLDLGATFYGLPVDVRSAYGDSSEYFRQLLKAGPRIVGAAERAEELSPADSTRVQDIAKAISEVLTGPVPNPTELEKLLESFEELLKEISGTEYIFL
jgi:hypothetical protein